MGLESRIQLYKELETYRKRPLIVYCTNDRQNAAGNMATDVIHDFLIQLSKLPKKADSLDLLLVSNGGDPNVAWRIVSLIRERMKKFSVLIPQGAYSAATLIALGADEIVMHPNGNLGPTDPQLTTKKMGANGEPELVKFGSEDISCFIDFARSELGITDQEQLTQVFKALCEGIGALQVGAAVRGSRLSLTMGEKLLQSHADENNTISAKQISESLNKKYFHHGYPMSRTEAKEIGLSVAQSDDRLEELIWGIWCDLAEDMKSREPFNPIEEIYKSKESGPLFKPAPLVKIPHGLPAEVQQQVLQTVLAQIQVSEIPAVDFANIHAALESSRYAAHYVGRGKIFGFRGANMDIGAKTIAISSKWERLSIPKVKAGSKSVVSKV